MKLFQKYRFNAIAVSMLLYANKGLNTFLNAAHHHVYHFFQYIYKKRQKQEIILHGAGYYMYYYFTHLSYGTKDTYALKTKILC